MRENKIDGVAPQLKAEVVEEPQSVASTREKPATERR